MKITRSIPKDFSGLWQRLREVQEPEDIYALLAEVDELEASFVRLWDAGKPSEEAISFADNISPRRFRRQCFQNLHDLTSENAFETHKAILNHLLPRCLRWVSDEGAVSCNTVREDGVRVMRPSREDDAVWEAAGLREELVKWLDLLPPEESESLHDEILQQLCEGANSLADQRDAFIEEVRAVCWTLNAIGRRSVEVEDVLQRFVATRNDLGGDSALSVLASLGGVPDANDTRPHEQEKRAQFLTWLRARSRARPNRFLGYALCVVAAPDMLEDALALFHSQSKNISYYSGKPRQHGNEETEFDEEVAFKATLLAQFANALPDEAKVQDAVWSAIFATALAQTGGWNELLSNSNLVRWCNSPQIMPDMAKLLQREIEQEKQDNHATVSNTGNNENVPAHHWTVYIAASRFQDALRPRQLEGWTALSDDNLAPFRDIAEQNTNQTGYHSTSPMQAKKIAWQTLVLAQAPISTRNVQDAVQHESSGDVLETVAPLGCQPLPPIVLDLLHRKLDLKDNGDRDTSPFAATRGAETLARAAANREAFTALLDFGFLYDGDVLRSTSDAVDDVAVTLARSGDLRVADDLFDAAQGGPPLNRRIVAVSAILALATRELLPFQRWRELLNLAHDEELDDFYASLAVGALGCLSAPAIEREITRELVQLWHEFKKKSEGKFSNLVNRAHEALARGTTWREFVSEDEFLSTLGLERQNGSWRLAEGAELDADSTLSLVRLYQNEPEVFEQAVCDALLKVKDQAHYALTFYLCAPNRTADVGLAHAFAEIMLRQVTEHENPFKSRLYLFHALAVGAPQLLLQEDWREVWSQWRSEARIALADALGLAAKKQFLDPDADYENIYLHLRELVRDGFYAVRRAAYRALSQLGAGESHLWEITLPLAFSEDTEERKRAAEAVYWFKDDIRISDGKGTISLRQILRHDRERQVREAVERAQNEHRDRKWADQYLDQILRALENLDDFRSVLPLGAALVHLGDDNHLRQIFEASNVTHLPPRVRLWLNSVHGKLEKKWHEKTQKWPEPWLQWEGIIEEVAGTLVQHEAEISVFARIWQRPRVGTRGINAWGGLIVPRPEAEQSIQVGEAVLRIPENREAHVLVSHQTLSSLEGEGTSSWALFTGQGVFP